jgi:hypothetical protein
MGKKRLLKELDQPENFTYNRFGKRTLKKIYFKNENDLKDILNDSRGFRARYAIGIGEDRNSCSIGYYTIGYGKAFFNYFTGKVWLQRTSKRCEIDIEKTKSNLIQSL